MKNPLPLLCTPALALLLVITLPAFGAEEPPKVELRVTQTNLAIYNAKVRRTVLSSWKVPALERTTTVRIKGTVDGEGKLSAVQLAITPALSAENDQKLRESLQEALGQTFATPPGGSLVPVEFKLVAQNGPFYGSCFPLKVYVPTTFADSPSTTIPETSVSALSQGIVRWNQALAERSGGKVSEAVVVVSGPEQATVRIEAYEEMPQFGPYFEDFSTGQMVVRVGLMRATSGALQSGRRLVQRLPVTHQAMFQVGRMLGLGPTDDRTNVLWPAPSAVDYRVRTDYASTKDVQVTFARSANVAISSGSGGVGGDPRLPNGGGVSPTSVTTSTDTGADDTNISIADRSFKPEQLDEVLKRIGENSCRP